MDNFTSHRQISSKCNNTRQKPVKSAYTYYSNSKKAGSASVFKSFISQGSYQWLKASDLLSGLVALSLPLLLFGLLPSAMMSQAGDPGNVAHSWASPCQHFPLCPQHPGPENLLPLGVQSSYASGVNINTQPMLQAPSPVWAESTSCTANWVN